MPRFAFSQLALLEVAAAGALGGLAAGGAWRVVGPAAGVVVLLSAVLPLECRWLYQAAASWSGLMLRRHRRRRRSGSRGGLEALVGEYTVVTVPGGGSGADLAVVRAGTTWCLPLLLGLDAVLNDDAPVPVRVLAELLAVEDVPLSSVRLFTLTTPARVPAGSDRTLNPTAARYCLITLDTRRAGEAIAARGGGSRAVEQILRRCAAHADRTFAMSGISVRRLREPAVHGLFASWLGPPGASGGRRRDRAGESWGEVRVAGTRSVSFAVGGSGDDLLDRVAQLAAAAPGAVVGSTLLLRRTPGRVHATDGRRPHPRDLEAAMIVRVTSPDDLADADTGRAMTVLARAYGLVVQRAGGEQGTVLSATVPIGVGEAA